MRPLAVTMGEPGGIGPELILDAWWRRSDRVPPFVAFADPALLAARAKAIGRDVPIEPVAGPDASSFDRALPVIALDAPCPDRPGIADPAGAAAVVEAIRRAVAATTSGAAAAVVTAPIQKSSLWAAGFHHPGHTEFLGELASAASGRSVTPVMMLACDALRVVPVTVHVPLADVPRLLTRALIVETARIVARDLAARFAVARPRLAVAGLNPHAGEGGAMGAEDEAIIRPAVADLVAAGIDARGPLSADTMFHAAARRTYDAALCMFHDQALIPIKTIAFDEGVNVTLGLPFVRTSPDHGTALDIAGRGVADPSSFIAALRLAARMTAPR